MKRCSMCKQELPPSRFYVDQNKSDGLTERCRVCHRHWCQDNIVRERAWMLQVPAASECWWRIERTTKMQGKPKRMHRNGWKPKNKNKDARAPLVKHDTVVVQDQYKRQKGRCYYCHAPVGDIYEVDHVIPRSRQGTSHPENLVIACPDCNQKKGNKMPHEWTEGGRLL